MKPSLLYRITDRLVAWHQRHLPGVDFIHVAAVVIGLMCGIGAGLLKNGVDFVTNLIFSHFDIHSVNLWFILLPIMGIFIATAFARYITRQPMDHASERIVQDMANGHSDLSPKLILGPIIGCSITLGLGGSAGAEDPIVYTGAAVGSNVGKAFRLQPQQLANLMGCGAAAAIAGIFMAPIGGVMFALEVLKMRQSLTTVLAIVLSSLVAALTCFIMLGCHTDITFVPEMRFDMHLIPHVLVCGVVCGLYSLYYASMMRRCRGLFKKLSNIWLRAAIGGVTLAALLIIFPSLYGEGYSAVHRLMLNEPASIVAYSPLAPLGHSFYALLGLMVIMLLVKPLATSATNDSGGIGGDFTPTFFCGGVVGFMVAAAANHLLGMHLPVAIFAFFGMAAVMAGAIRAPLMAIFIAAEMTGLYGFILPLTLAAMTSYLTTLMLSGVKIPLPFLHERGSHTQTATQSSAASTQVDAPAAPDGKTGD